MNKILIIDIETTGFSYSMDHIVEVGIVELNLDNGERKILFDEITHETGITREEVEASWIINNSDLTTEQVRQSPNLEKMRPFIQKIIDEYPLGATACNNKFDFGLLKNRNFKIRKTLPCPMLLSTDICKLPDEFNNGKFKWPSVEEAYKHFFPEIEYIEKHRGADDAMHEAEIVYELYKLGIFKLNFAV